MSIERVMNTEILRQQVVENSTKTKNVEPTQVNLSQGFNKPAVTVNIGSGLEKTAMLHAIYK